MAENEEFVIHLFSESANSFYTGDEPPNKKVRFPSQFVYRLPKPISLPTSPYYCALISIEHPRVMGSILEYSEDRIVFDARKFKGKSNLDLKNFIGAILDGCANSTLYDTDYMTNILFSNTFFGELMNLFENDGMTLYDDPHLQTINVVIDDKKDPILRNLDLPESVKLVLGRVYTMDTLMREIFLQLIAHAEKLFKLKIEVKEEADGVVIKTEEELQAESEMIATATESVYDKLNRFINIFITYFTSSRDNYLATKYTKTVVDSMFIKICIDLIEPCCNSSFFDETIHVKLSSVTRCGTISTPTYHRVNKNYIEQIHVKMLDALTNSPLVFQSAISSRGIYLKIHLIAEKPKPEVNI